MNTMQDLIKSEARMARFAKSRIDEGEEFQPMLEITSSDGSIMVIVLIGIFDIEMRPNKRGTIKAILRQHDAVSYVLASEAWMIGMDKDKIQMDEQGQPILERPIREDDRRKSVLTITGENLNGDMVFSARTINEKPPRSLPDKPDIFQTHTKSDPDRMQGDNMGLLE